MAYINTLVKENAVVVYLLLTFVISWGCMVLMVRPYSFPLTSEQSTEAGAILYIGMLVGPSVTSLLLTGVIDGKAGYRELYSRLSKWRVGVRWYLAALFGTPVLATTLLLALSTVSPEFTPTLFTTSDKTGLIIMGISVGLLVGVFEELGWSGFLVPRMKKTHNIYTTGLIVGLIWGAWHFPPFWEINSFSDMTPLMLLLTRLFAWLPPYRVLLVWVHDHTRSLSITMLMHASLVFTTLTLPPLELSVTGLLVWLVAWGALLWITGILVTKTLNHE